MEDPPTTDFGQITLCVNEGGRVKYNSIFSFHISAMGGAQNPKNPQTLKAHSAKTSVYKLMRDGIIRAYNKVFLVIV